MAYDPEQAPADPTYPPASDVYRDVAALLLILIGVIGLVTCAFLADRLLGAAVISAFSVAGGIVLGTRRR